MLIKKGTVLLDFTLFSFLFIAQLIDGRSIDTYRYWKVPVSIDIFFWYRYLLIDTLVFQFT